MKAWREVPAVQVHAASAQLILPPPPGSLRGRAGAHPAQGGGGGSFDGRGDVRAQKTYIGGGSVTHGPHLTQM